MSRHWRPSLGLVLGGALVGTLGLSLAGLVALRYLGPVIGFRAAAALLALAIAAGTALLGWLLWRLLLRPLKALETYARAQEAGDAAPPPAHFGTRETAATAQRVIAMAGALRDREATVRTFTDHVTHELKTPVASIRAGVELMQDSPLNQEDRALLATIDRAREQIEARLHALRQAAQARETRYLGTTRLADLHPALAAEFPALTLKITADAALPLAPEGMRIVLGHLLRNATEHGAGQVTLTARHDGQAILDVSDDGTGISAGNVRQVFTPFFTTRRDQGGTGMGLAIVKNLLALHRAEITLLDAPPTTFRLRFPAAA